MAKKHRFLATSYRDGHPEFEAGKDYDPTERSAVHVATGTAIEVEVPDPAPEVDAAFAPRRRRTFRDGPAE